MLESIKWLGHASFVIKAEKVIYIDPWKLKDGEPADIILITHDHYDHCCPEDVQKIMKPDTVIVATPDAAAKFKGNVKTMKPGDSLTVEGVPIEAVHAYNPRKQFHPKKQMGVGYIVTVVKKSLMGVGVAARPEGGIPPHVFDKETVRIYHLGDTDFIPEMQNIKADIALVPVGGTYTMDAEEAAKAVNSFMPKVAIPMHWGEIVGSEKDAQRFKELAHCEVKILTPEK
ncbi:MAG: MBL fold metallo-hydrolase [Candidatus Aminicenantes bacterium]|nr:MBL fold metallo-hydrolase [Candidatus Aminicenantes bacterium]